MPQSISFEKSKKSKIKRLSFLPRIGVTIDFGGRQFCYKNAPLAETILNMANRGFSVKNLIKISSEQLKEIKLHQISIKIPTKKKIKR